MLGGISPLQLAIVLVIVIMIFGTKKLRSMGGDLGGAIKGFKKAMKEEENKKDESQADSLSHNKEQADAEFTETKTTETEKDQPKS